MAANIAKGSERPALDRLEPALQLPLRRAEALDDAGDRRAREAYGLVAEWGRRLRRPTLERFCALARLGRYAEAFEEGRRLAKGGLSPLEADVLAYPWRRRRGGAAPSAAGAKDVSALRALARKAPRDPWPKLYLLQLLERPGGASSAKRRAELSVLIPRPLRWMRLSLARQAMRERDLEGAAREYGLAAGGTRPADWRAHGFEAEALICLGRAEEGLSRLDEAARAAGAAERGEALSWKGEMLLWLGRYDEALAALDEAAAVGARFSWCWRGAAKLLLGRPQEALADVERGLQAHPRDAEAVCWRAECLRSLGRAAEAAAALDAAPSSGDTREWTWHLVNRALARRDLGDASGARADLSAIQGPAAGWLEGRPGGRSLEGLEALLRAAKGFRRPEEYGFRLLRPAKDCC